MDDLIKRADLLERIKDLERNINDTYVDDVATRMILAIGRVKIIIKAMPPTSAERTGHWTKISPAKIYECSECGQNVMTYDIERYKYCPNCGCRMKGEEDA